MLPRHQYMQNTQIAVKIQEREVANTHLKLSYQHAMEEEQTEYVERLKSLQDQVRPSTSKVRIVSAHDIFHYESTSNQYCMVWSRYSKTKRNVRRIVP